MDIRGKRFVVIGGGGLIGSHTVELLLGHDVREVVVFDNFVRGTRQNLAAYAGDDRLRVFEAGGDILHTDLLADAMSGADGVFHFAALWLLQCEEYPRAAFDVNIQGTFNVLEAAAAAGIERLIFSSSASVYGDAVQEPMDEDHPFNNTNFYGATKISGEAMARAVHHRRGLPYVGLRYFNVYGPRQDDKGAYASVIMRMLSAVETGQPLEIHGDGSQAYDFVHVTDCARANVRAMQAETVDRFYNVCTGRKTSIRELADLILGVTGSDLEVRSSGEGRQFVTNRVGDPRRASAELGFDAEIGLADGLKDLVAWREADRAAGL